ncbi:shikimate kinase [Pandoraea cepalis]|uniref:Shikimate kinase n=1 Tax=Pandoraea cepalis TaxID=2508294 RepID=A0AAW7MK71_9BURK|nr:helix-turn-helix transcriptional regulator [Pandoraea cepalis]MDN4573050.1 shikimate kinase [Pandoraea cepalis]MDN4577855.1 shikimate kinase [Pandoraea cepalis]
MNKSAQADGVPTARGAGEKDPFLVALGERVRTLRARRGLTRKALALDAGVSERHVANLESGVGNASVLFLRQLAQALNCTLAEIVGDETTSSAEWLLIREILHGRDGEALTRARQALSELFAGSERDPDRRGRIALIGLRGAGKSTLGRMLADDMHVPFVELNRVIERLAGCPPSEIYSLYGASAYRRYELRALEAVVAEHPRAVIASPGGIVSDAATFNFLLTHCYTVWLQASPEEHMKRVVAQGDLRPMSGNAEAMDDLKRILAGRQDFYAKADMSFDTGGRVLADAYLQLRGRLAVQLSSD